ncbi:g735 [Coccomyxa elongata]
MSFLDEDPVIPGQTHALVSLVVPMSMMEKRTLFLMDKYLRHEAEKMGIRPQTDIEAAYSVFLEENSQRLDQEFASANKGATSIMGIKIRGVCGSLEEGKCRAKKLQQADPDFNVFLAECGKWLPLTSNLESIINEQEYLNSELNTFMKGYKENMARKDEHFEAEKRERVNAAKRDAEATKRQAEAAKRAADDDGKNASLTESVMGGSDPIRYRVTAPSSS